MPDSRKHRGQNPADAKLFAPSQVPKLQQAVRDLSWLLSRGYSEKSSLRLVGNRYRLQSRQRLAVSRSSCSRQSASRRRMHTLPEEAIRESQLLIDGFNLLITVESALSDGFVLEGVDGCYRDMASIHGSYKRVMETAEAIVLVGQALDKLGAGPCTWYLDRPVSNSGRLKMMILETADKHGWDWQAELDYNPDNILIESSRVAVSSDSVILDKAAQWFNLARYVVHHFVPDALILPLGKLARADI